MPEYIPDDPLFAQQWFLRNTGQVSGAVAGFDLNVTQVWPDYTGAGVHIGVYDNGVDYNHPDLNDNYDASRQVTFNGNPVDPIWQASPDPSRYNNLNYHGTEIAGVIAAEDNDIGGVGVAFGAHVTGVLAPLGPNPPDAQLVQAMQQLTNFDIATFARNNGIFSDGRGNANFSSFWAAVDNAVSTGRGGLGTILVRAENNNGPGFGGEDGNDAGFRQDYQLISVGAVQSSGVIAPYVTRGSEMLVSAFSGYAPEGDNHNIVTTDISGAAGQNAGDYAAGGGTSLSHPEVAGVVALMLQANPNLGWRDVQTILANSARHVGSDVGTAHNATETVDWAFNGADNWNGGGRHFSNDYGYGTVDALAAVRMAETWGVGSTAAATTANQSVVTTQINTGNQAIPDNTGGSVSFSFNVASNIRIESARVFFNITHTRSEDLHMTLTSPDGTVSQIWNPPIGDVANPGQPSQGTHAFPGANPSWAFVSQEFRGELSAGTWTVTITDLVSGNTGFLPGGTNTATLQLRGSTSAVANTKYVYTNEFSDYADLGSRSTLTDADAGTDTINAAAVTSASTINLNAGSTSTIDGHALTIAVGSSIENAVGGDGDDTLIGNDADNVLWGGRGSDSLDGGLGNDTLNGGTGADTMTGGDGNDIYYVDVVGDVVTENANEGTDEVRTGLASYTLAANVENLTGTVNTGQALNGNSADNIITGGSGNDTLNGGSGDDTMLGGSGNDSYRVDSAGDVVTENANEGSDTVVATVSYTIPNNVEALYLKGTGLTGTGSAGDDILLSAASGGANTMVGLGGNDLYYVNHAGDVVTEVSGEGADTVVSTVSYTIPDNVETMYLVGSGLTGTGSSNGETLISSGGPNTLIGLGGDDLYIVQNAGDVVTEAANGGIDTVVSTVSYTMPANCEGLYLVGSGLTGTGSSGADTLLSSGGPNTLIGGDGNDIYYVNNTGDVVTEGANGGIDTIATTVSYALPANVEALYLLGSGLTGTGTNAGETLLSSGGPNTMIGLGGDDLYYVNNTGDVVTEAANGGFDSVVASVSYTLAANVDVLYMSGTGLTGTGNSAANTLTTTGANTLVGGAGDDAFVFFAGTANGAAVSDFDGNAVGEHDYLILSGFGTTAQGATFTQIGVSDNWQIHSGLDSHDETVTFSNHALPQAGDFIFV